MLGLMGDEGKSTPERLRRRGWTRISCTSPTETENRMENRVIDFGTESIDAIPYSNRFKSNTSHFYSELELLLSLLLKGCVMQSSSGYVFGSKLLKLKLSSYLSYTKCPKNTEREMSSDFLKGSTNRSQF